MSPNCNDIPAHLRGRNENIIVVLLGEDSVPR